MYYYYSYFKQSDSIFTSYSVSFLHHIFSTSYYFGCFIGGKIKLDFPGGSVVKNLPAKQETQVQSLCWEEPLEKEVATHSSILAWRITWTKKPGGLQSMGSQRVRHD